MLRCKTLLFFFLPSAISPKRGRNCCVMAPFAKRHFLNKFDRYLRMWILIVDLTCRINYIFSPTTSFRTHRGSIYNLARFRTNRGSFYNLACGHAHLKFCFANWSQNSPKWSRHCTLTFPKMALKCSSRPENVFARKPWTKSKFLAPRGIGLELQNGSKIDSKWSQMVPT